MSPECESEDSEDNYDDPNYWFQVGDQNFQNLEKARNLNSDSNSEVENFDDVIVVDSEADSWFDLQNQNQILNEEVIYTPEEVEESEDVIILGEYPQHPHPPQDHTYSKPDSRGARIQMIIDDVVRQNRFRRRRRDVKKPARPKSKLYHQTSGAIPYTKKIQKTLECMEMERWCLLRIQNPMIWPPDFHGFSFLQLCHLAIRNSPSGMVSSNCAFNFILHHFPHYRFDRTFTMDRVRNALRRKGVFQSVAVAGSKRVMYHPTNPTEMEITEEQFLAMDMDPRGRAFFDRMLNGELGLPRQLFYHVIGSPCPQLAGPENSALFYHLLSLGHIPPKGSAHFKMHPDPCLAVEPRFDEDQILYPATRSVRDVEKLEFFGVNGMENAVDEEYSNRFFASIFGYFGTQNYWKSTGRKNWQTPILT